MADLCKASGCGEVRETCSDYCSKHGVPDKSQPSDQEVLKRFHRWALTLTHKEAGEFWDDVSWLQSFAVSAIVPTSFLLALAETANRGCVVSSGDCSLEEIALARAEGRFWADADTGLGFVRRKIAAETLSGTRELLDSMKRAPTDGSTAKGVITPLTSNEHQIRDKKPSR